MSFDQRSQKDKVNRERERIMKKERKTDGKDQWAKRKRKRERDSVFFLN